MSKKLLGICTALMALAALAIPASASAVTPRLAETSGPGTYSTLATGVQITATQDEHSVFEAAGSPITCSENWMTGEVHTNDATNGITGTITAASFTGTEKETKCSSSLLGPTRVKIPVLTNEPKDGGNGGTNGKGHWCIKNVAGADQFEVLGRGCTEAGNGTLTFILEGSFTCYYDRSEGVKGSYTTTEEDPKAATLKVTGEPTFTKESPSNFLCPSSGKITTMSFYLYTHNPEETPIYIEDV